MARMRGIHGDVIRGSIAGNTFTSNQFHQIVIRQRTSPVNPCTNRQTQIRAALSYASAQWLSISPTYRQGWNDYAETLHYPNPLGPILVPGRQVFIGNVGTAKYLLDRGQLTGPLVFSAPTTPGFLGISDCDYDAPIAAGTGYSLTIGFPSQEDSVGFAFRSFPFNPTRLRYKGPFLTETLDSVELSPPATGYIDFLSLRDGMIYFNAVRGISKEGPYRLSPLVYIRAIASITT